jgi:hypothetical protein
MKLPRLRRPAPEPVTPAPEPAEPGTASPAVPAFLVLAYARSGLSDQEFSAQTEALRNVASYDADTRSWYAWLLLDRPGRAAEVLTALFDAARVHGTTIQVQARPAGEGTPPEPS